MKLCVIGNSHLGALKESEPAALEHSGLKSIEFFAKGSNGLKDLQVDSQSKSLVPATKSLEKSFLLTSDGSSTINAASYDAFLVYGLGYQPFFQPKQFYSSNLNNAAFIDSIHGSLLFEIIAKVREVTDKPIFIGHVPFRAVESIEKQFVDDSYLAVIDRVNRYVERKFLNTVLIHQPIETICDGRRTRPEFCRGSIRMATGDSRDNTEHPENDLSHMNSRYGEFWWKNFLQMVFS